MQPFGVIVLAAGESRRFGSPKQLAHVGGESLIRRAVTTASTSGASRVLVVVGANREAIEAELSHLTDFEVVVNPLWEGGMASSIRAGIAALPDVLDVTVLMACDQPAVTPEHLKHLAAALERSEAAASAYDRVVGIPCAFKRSLFPELMRLTGDEGARTLLRRGWHQVAAVPLPGGENDIDIPLN